MTKILKVIKPFYVLEEGDTLELSKDGSTYSSVYNEEHHEDSDDNSTVTSSYSSVYSISTAYAKTLVENGYLEEVKEQKDFVNIFDEIDRLLTKYYDDLNKLLYGKNDDPKCMQVEKETVLQNMIKLLEHLKNLKK